MKNSILPYLFAPLHRLSRSARPVLALIALLAAVFAVPLKVFAVGGTTVTSVTPASGTTTGGNVVTITGSGFTGVTGVTIGGTAVTSFHVISPTSIEAVTPVGTAGAKSVVVTAAGGPNPANTLFTYNTAVASTVVDFEPTGTGGSGVPVGSTFPSSGTWSLTGFLVDGSATSLGSSPVGSATAASDHYLDTGFNPPTTNRSPGSMGFIVAPTGKTFRAVGIDIWPSSCGGNGIIPYASSPGSLNFPGETGHTFTVKGYRNNAVVVNINVIDTLRTPPQSGSVDGGYWHHLEFTNSAFDTTDIDKLEIITLTQSGTAFDGPNSGSPLTTPNYIALDNFVYSNLGTAAAASVTVPGGTATLTTTTSGTAGGAVNFSITGANLTGAPGNLTVTAPPNVQVSADNSSWGGTASIPYTTATLASTPVYVRLAGTGSVGTISGNVSISGGGLSAAVTKAVSGTLNPAPIAVTSLTRVGGAVQNGGFVFWNLTFASPVTGLSASNFTLSGAAAAGSSVASPGTSTGGLSWNIPVSTGSTDGPLTLNLANSTGLSSAISPALPFTGDTITIDKTPPTIVSITRITPTSQNTNLTTVTFHVTYSEPVNLNAPATSRFQVVPVGGSTIVGTVTGVTGTGNARDVTVNLTSGVGEFKLRAID